ncbi:MAG: phage holin family protein [Lachnospiraceae bacterium]|nr:phage holin family protein [Lachnospiraceae bacterium]
MKPFTDTYNLAAGMIVSIMTAIFGIYWYIFAAYLLFNIMDWLTGWYNSRRKKTESSSVGLRGIIKKLGYWIIIAVAFLMSDVFVRLGTDILGINLDFLLMIGWFTLACLMVNEVRSILENLVECGYEVPKVLIDGLLVADKMINKESEDE